MRISIKNLDQVIRLAEIRSGHSILIYSAWQGLNTNITLFGAKLIFWEGNSVKIFLTSGKGSKLKGDPFQKGIGVRESKKEVTKIVSHAESGSKSTYLGAIFFGSAQEF